MHMIKLPSSASSFPLDVPLVPAPSCSSYQMRAPGGHGDGRPGEPGHEGAALDAYQRRTGWEVGERNAAFVRWVIPLSGAVDDPSPPPRPTARLAPLPCARPPHGPLHGDSGADGSGGGGGGHGNCIDLTAEGDDADADTGCFVLVGTVDGIAEELDASAEDPAQWQMRRRVVEIKHRMSRRAAQQRPPLHDELQLAMYELMHGVDAGDLVQVYRDVAVEAEDGPTAGGTVRDADEGARTQAPRGGEVELEMSVFPVTLDGCQLRHRHHIYSVVIPRLRLFVAMLQRLRQDDCARWQFLLAPPAERWACVERDCQYLRGSTLHNRPTAPAAHQI
jgi:hypothetical protein